MKKINYSKLMVLGIVFYIVLQGVSNVFSMSIKTEVLENGEYKFLIKEKGLIIKNQEIIYSDIDGYFESIVKENEKIKKGQVIGYIYENNNEFQKYKEEIKKLNKEVELLDIELRKEISDSSKELLNMQKKLKQNEIDKIASKLEKSKEVISPISGRVSFYYNEDEKEINIKEISDEQIQNNNMKYEKIYHEQKRVKNKEAIVRIIDTNETFIAFSVEEDKIDKFEIGKNVNLGYYNKEINTEIPCEVYDIYKNEDKYTLIVRFIGENEEIYNTISKEFDIIYNNVEGIKVPKSATKVLDGKIGVYVVDLQNNIPYFVELKEIIFEDNEFFYIDFYKVKREGIKTVKIHDEIILNPNFINTKMKVK